MLQSFCKKQGFPDGELVTEKKLVYFLDTEVLNRPLRSSQYKKDRTRPDGSKVEQTLGSNSITQYINAIVDLWKFQKSIGTNSFPNPRGYAVSALMTGRLHKESERKREQYLDRAAGTLQDGYSKDKIKDFVRYCWQGWRTKDLKHRKPQAQESYLRTAVDFLFSHNMLLRGESRRQLQFPDLFTISLPNEGPTPCWPMIMIMNNGKTNQFGRLQYMGVMRHQDPLLCTMSQAAFYLFYRWQIAGESPPRFRSRPEWYNFHFFKGSDREKPISYEIQLKWANEVYKAINLSTDKKTHAGRAQGSKQAELEGVEENKIRRAGQWNQDALTNCYLTHLPRKFLRSMAGFQPDAIGNYYLPRAKIQPPDSLVRALWPWIDQWLAWFQSNDPTNEPPSGATSQEQEDRDDMAAQGFLQLLNQLRIILLQDSVLLQAQFPRHSMWDDPIFAREDYTAFAEQIRQSLLCTETPQEIQLRQTLPIIADRLSVLQKDIHQAVDRHGYQAHEQLRKISRQLHDLLSGHVTFAVRAMDASIIEARTPDSDSFTPSSQLAACLSEASSLQPPVDKQQLLPQGIDTPSSLVSPSRSLYSLSRTTQTVPEVWREWICGLGANPSVQSLERSYGATWRPSSRERVMFCRRKVIIDEIYARYGKGLSLDAAVEELELVRCRGKLSLYQLSQLLSKAR
ncbi:short-chain dehydrogenase [Penicillium argentinense]|uniref:Short-chain dehydrogenase n=1 Tax=Penicillium argentinense TaxID=1131581 RepID=A0A9W9KME1_9EURO|nr:short-chain dehydrogenase [Penicillium argentinense]KAJ5110851.1 short-chain dehydrogenase [Penicillium argentinense]